MRLEPVDRTTHPGFARRLDVDSPVHRDQIAGPADRERCISLADQSDRRIEYVEHMPELCRVTGKRIVRQDGVSSTSCSLDCRGEVDHHEGTSDDTE